MSFRTPLNIVSGQICDIIGFSGARTTVKQRVELCFSIAAYKMFKSHSFAILIGLDFMTEHKLSIDFKNNVCRRNFDSICEMIPLDMTGSLCSPEILLSQYDIPSSHQLKVDIAQDDPRFEISSN